MSATPAAPELAVPLHAAPVVDGEIGDVEWAGAVAVTLEHGVTLRLMHDGARVYLGISGLTPPTELGYACVLVGEPARVRVLHASAKLGSAIYTAGADGRFHPASRTYEWRTADTLLRDEGWMATTVSEGKPHQQEFALTFPALGFPDHGRRIALGYFHIGRDVTDAQHGGAVVWPSGLDDAVGNVELLAGFNPDNLTFEPGRWVALRPLR